MRLIGRKRGQSTAEYAVLFAIVIGAAIAMQQFVKARLQGAIEKRATEYANSADSGTFEPAREVSSQSAVDLTMESATEGDVVIGSESTTTVTKEANSGGDGGDGDDGGPPGDF